MLNPEISGFYKDVLKMPVFRAAAKTADKTGVDVFVIGGFVRDLILQRPCNDIDFVVVGNGTEFARMLALELGIKREIDVFKNFGTAHFFHDNFQIEIVGARRESYRTHSRKPLVEDGTLEDDQNRRDFTINALAIQLNTSNFGRWMDPFGGLKDLADGIIRTPLAPDITYSDDPLRMMRAIRFACQLNFTIEPESFKAISRNSHRIKIVSAERVLDELNKIILSETPSRGFIMLSETGLLGHIFPKLLALKGAEYIDGKGHKDNFLHTLEVLDKLCTKTDKLWLRWAALLHDIAKPLTKKFEPGTGWTFHGHEFKGSKMIPAIFRELKLPMNEKMKYVQKMVLLHLRPIVLSEEEVTDSAVRRLLFEAGDDIDDLMMLCEADITSKNPEKVKQYLGNFELVRKKLKEIEEKDKLRNWQPPVSGELIMSTFGIPPSVKVGIIKTAIREAILDGVIPNEYTAAYELMLKEGKKLGLKIVKMHAYRFRILTDEQDDFVRDIEIMANQTFLDFHHYLIRLLEFNSNELASFSICNSRWYKLSEITLLDMQLEDEQEEEEEETRKNNKLKTFLMADSKLNSFIEDPHQRMVYEYDFLNLRTFYLELTKIIPAELGIQYPRCVLSEGSLIKKNVRKGAVVDPNADIDLGDLDLDETEKEFDDGLDDSFLQSINDGYEIELDQSIEMNMEEPFEAGAGGETSKS